MLRATFRFYAELNDFLPPARRRVAFVHEFPAAASIKDRIEALGPPHTEVELILANDRPVGFDYRVQDGDRIAVYPPFSSLSIDAQPLRPPPPQPARFVLDTHLGKLTHLLRMLGFDALYRNDYDDADLARIASREARILLTRDRGVLKRSEVVHGYYVRSLQPQTQIVEVLRRYRLADQITPFRRCIACNGRLEPVAKEAILDRLEPKTRLYYDEYHRCCNCDQIYWKGSHYERMRLLIRRLRHSGKL